MMAAGTGTRRTAGRGAKLGVVAGALLAAIYGQLILGALLAYVFASAIREGELVGFLFILPVFSLFWIVGTAMALIMGVVPASVIGLVTGLLIGIIVARLGTGLSKLPVGAVSSLVALLVVLALHAVLAVRLFEADQPVPYLPYFTYLGLPSIIYILASIWLGWHLYTTDKEGFPRGVALGPSPKGANV
ncbi:MAG TPA: hypothetical protein VER55_10455 [Ardenticatenaceae bacterium]|nr:hypothetical protein [Ardenticatenaceae bacterium]